MIVFEYAWVFWLLPLPLLLFYLLPGHQTARPSVRIPRLWRLSELTGRKPSKGAAVLRRGLPGWLLLITCWLLVVTSVARPQKIGEPISRTIPSRDLLLAVDLSGSMSTEDFLNQKGEKVDRLTACKEVLDEFLTRRQGDRVGLIFFGTAAFVQAPFTEDLQLCRTLLDEAQVGMAGPQTVIGDAVGLALTVFDRSEQDDRVLIVLTDGNDTGSSVPPEDAARIGRDKGVTIHTIAVGDPTAVGEEAIDEEVLKDMASITGGGFYRASDRNELEEIYQKLDELETKELETESYQPKSELFFWPLSLFLLLNLGVYGFRARSTLLVRAIRPLGLASLLAAGLFWINQSDLVPPQNNSLIQFHFLRPFWLFIVVPIVGVANALIRKEDVRRGLESVIAPHLLKHLLVRPMNRLRIRPFHGLVASWLVAVFAVAGPTWKREASPFANNEAAIVFVQEVTPTMMAQDIQPSRLRRSAQKIGDLLELRAGADAALIAYSGSAHLVTPLTGDRDLVTRFASELKPEIMPTKGDCAADAVRLANQVLDQSKRVGSIVLITDGVNESQNQALADVQGAPVHIFAVAGDQSRPLPLDSPPAPAIDMDSLKSTASSLNASLTIVSAEPTDVDRLNRQISSSFVAALAEGDENSRWLDFGYWLTPLILLIVLYGFRKGWEIDG